MCKQSDKSCRYEESSSLPKLGNNLHSELARFSNEPDSGKLRADFRLKKSSVAMPTDQACQTERIDTFTSQICAVVDIQESLF